jgi:hypothetical protein
MEHILGWGDVSFFFVCWYAVAIILLIIALRVCLSTVTKNYLFKTQSQKKEKNLPPFFNNQDNDPAVSAIKISWQFPSINHVWPTFWPCRLNASFTFLERMALNYKRNIIHIKASPCSIGSLIRVSTLSRDMSELSSSLL